jgi:putative PEP-CTERM system TPR-repeat lipoprotein
MNMWNKTAQIALTVALMATLGAGCGKRAPDPGVSLADGKAALKAGDNRKALVQLKNVVQAQPENGEARFLLAEASYAIRDLAAAKKEFERAYDLGYNRDETSLRLAELMQESGDNKAFIDKFSEYQSPNTAVQSEIIAQVGRARLTLATTDAERDAAKRDFQKALAVNPNEKLAKIGMIRLQGMGGDNKGALKAIDQLIEQSPDYALAWIGRSELMRTFSDVTGSISAMERAAQLKPTDLTLQANLASMYLNAGRTEAADKAIEALRSKAPPSLSALHYLISLRSFQKGNLLAAQESINTALKLQPETIPYVLLAATIESAAGNFEQAEKYASFVMARSSDKTYARTLLASAHIRAQKGAQALELLEPMIKEGSKDPNVFALAGEAAVLSQDIKAAEKYFEMAAKLAPDDPAQKSRLALARIGSGDATQAIADLEAAVKMDAPGQYSEILLIMTYLRQKQFDKALTSIDTLEKKQPNNVLIYNLRATAFLGKRDAPAARASLEKGLALKPDSMSLVQNLARIDLLENKPTAAVERIEAFNKKFPSDQQGVLALAQLKEQLKAPNTEVLALYEKAQQMGGRSSVAPMQLASFLTRIGDNPKALAVLREAAQKSPEDVALLQRYGGLQVAQKDGQGAIATFSKLTKLQPHIALAWMQLAEAYVVAKNDAGAVQSLNRALEIKPSPPQAKAMLAQVIFRQGNKAEAERLAEEITKESPKSTLGFGLAADLAIAANDWSKAAQNYKRALAVDPKNGGLAGRYHNALVRAGQTADAKALADRYAKDNPTDAMFLTYQADVELRGGRCAQAIPFYQRVIERDANNIMALNNLAWCSHAAKLPDAIGIAERALKMAPRAPAIQDTVAVILSEKGEHERAIKLLTEASNSASSSAEIKLHLAQAYGRAGQKERARQEADAALKIPAPEALQTLIRQFISQN